MIIISFSEFYVQMVAFWGSQLRGFEITSYSILNIRKSVVRRGV
jgi:hypothetical protein